MLAAKSLGSRSMLSKLTLSRPLIRARLATPAAAYYPAGRAETG
jgi:hypothetical protein